MGTALGLVQFKNCLANVRLHVPEGLRVSVAGVTTGRYVYLDPGIHGRQTWKFALDGKPLPAKIRIDLCGPYDSDYESSDAPFAPLSWTKCGG